MKKYIYPKKIIHSQSNWLNLLKKQELQIGLSEKITSTFQDGDYVILDFGVEICGGIRILTYKAKNVPIRVRFGESITECCAEIGEKNATNDHSLRDFNLHLQNYSDTSFGRSGFRFVRLDFYGTVELKSIVAESRIAKKAAFYKYNGEDFTVKKIYECAKRTIDLCIESGYVLDGIKRDRLVWVGDMHPEMLALTTLYGRVKELEKSLDFVKNQTPLPGWMNGYPMYSMWWIIVIADYYERTQARSFVEKQIDYLTALLNQMDLCIHDNGELNYPFYFVDWPTCKNPVDQMFGVRAINIIAVKKAIDLLNEFGKSTSLATNLLDRLLKVAILPTQSKQVTALKYFALGYLSDEDRQNLLKGGAKGLSTFMSYYILKAIASFDKEQAITIMKEYYGAMLDKGATTFWEDFDMDWVNNSCRIDEFPKENQKDIHGDFGDFCYKGFRHSLCHGWSSGVLAFLNEEQV